MKGISLVLALAAFHAPAPHHHNQICTAKGFAPFSAAVWNIHRWERGAPKRLTIATQRKALRCAGPRNRAAMQRTWRRDKTAYNDHRRWMLWLKEYKPFVYPDGTRWAVPYPIAWCESGGNYFVGPSGAYGLIPPFPQWLSPRAQDRIAHDLYEEQGEGPWAPYEGGCAYR